MSRLGWLLALALFLPQTSSAIQLRWSDGSSNLTFGTATRCTLLVQADPAEGALPGQWRLLWLADSSGIAFVEEDSVAACSADTARVFTIQPPATTADSAAHEITTRFCSADEAAASVAIFVLDQPGWSKGKLKVVAINPSDPDSNEVIESNEVTYNGGVEGTYPSVALAASSSHTADQFVVHATGTGLSDVVEVIAQAPDSLWSLRLQIIEQSESVLTAVAEVVASMPASVLRLSGQSGTVAVAPLAADGQREGVDPDFEALADSCRQHHCYYFDPDPNVYPKDFAFFYAIAQNPVRGLFHLFYIREFRNVPATSSSRSFGHAWSSDLRSWESDTSAAVFSVSANEWDGAHVWAPSIVQVGPSYHMFYTGVDQPDFVYGNQRIGYATTTAIDTGHATVWTRRSAPTFTANKTGWAWRDSTSRRQQFRDPFIMADPDSSGRYLLFMVGQKQDVDYAVGVARNRLGTLDDWEDLGYYRSTEREYSTCCKNVESVMAFPDSAYPGSKTSAEAAWRLMYTWGSSHPDSQDFVMRFSTKAPNALLGDTTLTHWTAPASNLFTYLNGDSTAWGTYATEHLRVGRVDFLATFDGAGILVSRMVWDGTDFTLIQPSVTAVEGGSSEPGARVALRVVEALPGAGRLEFEIDMPTRERVRLGVYDVAGRRVRSLIDDQVPPGRLRVRWDGKDQVGNAARTGMYFAKLSGEFGSRVVRAAFVR